MDEFRLMDGCGCIRMATGQYGWIQMNNDRHERRDKWMDNRLERGRVSYISLKLVDYL